MDSLPNRQLSPRVGYIACRPLIWGPFGHRKPPCVTAVLCWQLLWFLKDDGSDTVRPVRRLSAMSGRRRGLAAVPWPQGSWRKRLRDDDVDSRIKQCKCIRCKPSRSDLDLSIAIKNGRTVTLILSTAQYENAGIHASWYSIRLEGCRVSVLCQKFQA